MSNVESVVALAGVDMTYESPDGMKTPVLRGIDLQANTGESLAVIGPSGSGKSTLLNIMGTLDRPTTGTVLLNGRDVLDLDDRALSRLRSNEVGFVFQLHHLLPQCTVLENVLIPTLVAATNTDPLPRAEALLDRVGLSHRLYHRPSQLSGGERQRVAVVRALINRPRLLLADEPTGSLDREGAQNLIELLVDLNSENKVTTIIVTHSEDLAKQMNRVLELRDGKLRELSDS